MPKPPQLTPLDVEKQRFYSKLLPDVRASHPISKEETHFSCFSFFTTTDRLSARITADAAPIRLLIYPHPREQDPEILELLHLGQDLLPNLEKALYLFPSEDYGL
ncbi:hypothetical protein D4764_06G0007520 [Takifugu flavidus]|uniref:Uncharacterized protein n=1 Tax=Takifugu flavidus TaxID=433684 RepID=A0A5C6MVH9_9TELE|nr:hypothetical protein D4764_06G0007520 [Takifugu flavidus]